MELHKVQESEPLTSFPMKWVDAIVEAASER